MTLSEIQINRVLLELKRSGLTLSLLQDDLLDHICCDVEQRMDGGAGFEPSMHISIRELAPAGLKEIELETILLLNDKLIPMKKLTYLIGLISSMMMTGGWLMSILHWPGGFNIGTGGLVAFFVLFLPLLAVSKFRSAVAMPSHEKIGIILCMLSGLLLAVGASFKLMHMPGANLSLLTGASLFTVGYLPFLFFGMYKRAVA